MDNIVLADALVIMEQASESVICYNLHNLNSWNPKMHL